ncbi:class IV adenylate cyclase [Salinispira pacifica]|uniref:Adenylate cyclase n=1 Tax=Salinispira pacifica TaxID=1307761 RepID=V5WHI4_9SPIO|nr:class IV adenylate cyclase [Salinispira pacifica]AHC15065.1 Adenylate cyclase [Salinispira pacifica]
MNTEIEMKAWVESPERTRELILRMGASLLRTYEKSDSYYAQTVPQAGNRDVRLRMDGDSAVVTMKDKTLHEGLETNSEREFTVSHPENFTFLLENSGYRLKITKHKEGEAYRFGEYLLELSHVRDLGWFLEIERVIPGDARPEQVEQSRTDIQKMFSTLEIPPSAVESRRYTQMLEERKG